VHDGKTLLYRASKLDCDPCPLKRQGRQRQIDRQNSQLDLALRRASASLQVGSTPCRLV
jgi:hypothetical protein